MTEYTELYMDQGTTFETTIRIKDDSTNSNINVSGWTVQSQLRRSFYSENATANLTCTIIDSTNGLINISMTSANTALVSHGRYLFDVVTTDTSGYKTKALEGLMIVNPAITI